MSSKGRPIPSREQRSWPALFLALACCGQSFGDLQKALAQLKAEANEAQRTGEMADKPDFAARFEGQLSTAELQGMMIEPADADAFVDAYIRWQLTSFDFQPSWSDREFLQLLQQLPKMVENPRGEGQLIQLLERAVASSPLDQRDVTRLQELSSQLDEQEAEAQRRNLPAIELRHWLREAVGETGPRHVQLIMEHCAATIDAAWSTQGIKMRLSLALTATAEQDTLTNAQRRMLAGQLRNLAGRHRRYVNQITIMADGSVHVTYSNARVTQRDVDGWVQRMAGQH